MTDFVPAERATPIRQPSTANFLIDSDDNINGATASGLYTISKGQSLLNGFFTRLGVTEVALEWYVPNVIADLSYNQIFWDVSGTTLQTPIVTVPVGSYSAADFLNTLVAQYNALPSASRAATTIAISSTGGTYTLTMTGGQFAFPVVLNTNRVISRFFTLSASRTASQTRATSVFLPSAPATGFGISRFSQNSPKFLDFVCRELTYNQSLKDATTNLVTDRDVLCRFYLAYENDMTQVDSLGFPLMMTYKPSYIRRNFNPPKQIRWTANQPVGNLTFEVYDDNGNLFDVPGYDWRMTIQVSEV